MGVELQPITKHNVTDVCRLQVTAGQERFVPPNAWSLAQALPELDPEHARGWPFWLWHLMVGADHQGRGFGRTAVALAAEEVRRRGGDELRTSWLPGDGGPEGFYRKVGFVPTVETDDEGASVVGRLDLCAADAGLGAALRDSALLKLER